METSKGREASQSDGLALANYRPKGLLKRITPQSRFYWTRQLLENPTAVASLIFIVTIIVLTVAITVLLNRDLDRIDPTARLLPPSSEFWMGTDHFGRDVLLRAIYGVRVTLLVGASVMLVSAIAGTVIGLISGYYQRADTPIMRVMDGLMAFPPILLAIALMASLGPSTVNVVVALGVVYMPIISRLIRGSTLSIKQQAFVEAARSIGARDHTILMRHVFPNALSPLIVQCTFIVALAIIAESSLSFLGAGVPPEVPTWGSMLQDGQRVITSAWWMVLVPGSFLFLTVLSLNMLGDGLRDALDPRSRER
jgi:peptide/nickel transport system permease protein